MSITQYAFATKRAKTWGAVFDDGMEEINNAILDLTTIGVDDTEIIHHATAMLDELDKARAKLLAIRAQALGKQAKFEQAITDVTKAIDTSPISGQLYLLAGKLHIAHGKPKLAIDVLENGLCSTLPSDWPSLYDEREVAKRLSEAKVDFVSVMPPEVTARIFTGLPVRYVAKHKSELLNSTLVSKSWRVATLGCSRLWNTAQRINYGATSATLGLLPLVCHHVEQLDLCNLSRRETQELETLATQNMLQSVTKMALKCIPSSIQLHLVSILGKQLTQLKYDYRYNGDQDDGFPLDTVLATCQSLKAFTLLYYGQGIRYQPSPLPNTDFYNIEMISICRTEDEDDYDSDFFLRPLILRCPQLRSLNLSRYTPGLLELVAERCLQLEEISIHETEESEDTIWRKEFKKRWQPTTGLKRIEYENFYGEGTNKLRDLVPLWTKWKNTLQKMNFTVCEDDITTMRQEDWDSLLSDGYPHLKKLSIVNQFEHGRLVVEDQRMKLLSLCPSLEGVALGTRTVPNDILCSLTTLSYLRQLCLCTLDMSSGGFRQYLKLLSKYDQKSNLNEIHIWDCETMTDQDLSVLADVPSLEIIDISSGEYTFISSSGITAFLRKLKSNANLQFLCLSEMPNFTRDCIPAAEELVELIIPGSNYRFTETKRSLFLDPYYTPSYDFMFDRRKVFTDLL